MLLWEEGEAVAERGDKDVSLRALDLYLEAFRTTRAAHEIAVTPAPNAVGPTEKAKVANNLLYFALEYLEHGGLEESLTDSHFTRDDIPGWLRAIGADEIDKMTNSSFVDTARKALVFIGDWDNAEHAARRILELVTVEKAATSKFLTLMRRDAKDTLSRASARRRSGSKLDS